MAPLTPFQLAHPFAGSPSYVYVVRHFVSVIAAELYGKALLTVWISYFVWLFVARRRRGQLKEKRSPRAKTKKKKADALSQLVKMLAPAMKGERRWIGAYVASLSTRVLITVQIADLSGRLGGYMAVKQWDAMFRGQAWFGLWCMAAAATTAAMKYLEKRMAMSVRHALYERLLSRYMESLHYYRLPLDDASSRLTSDLAAFSEELTHTFGFIVKPCIDVSYLTAVLTWRLGPKSMGTLYAFIIVASKSLQRAKQLLPRSLKSCSIEKSELESSLRTAHDRLHTYREQIALQAGTRRERVALSELFKRVVRNEHEMLWSKAIIDTLNSYVLKYGGMMCGFSILIEPVYRGLGKYANATMQDITAGMMADINLLNSLSTAVGDLADSFVSVPRLRGLAERVYDLEKEMLALPPRHSHPAPAPVAAAAAASTERSRGILAENLTIQPPGTKTALFTGLTISVGSGQHTVVRGPNGVGKTSLFRTLGGLWDAGADATLQLPATGMWIFPQDCYFPHGSLAEQISYPDGDHELVNNNNPTARAEAQSLLEVVGLGPWLTAQKYDLESVQDWHSVLSGGQKQRLAWVRMFFHRPDFALIDEGTSAVDRDSVDLLFLHAKEQLGITMLTISHSEVVDAHHKQALDLDQGGRWQITDDVATPRDGTDSPDAAATQAEKSASNALEELLEELEKALATHKSEGSDTPGSALGRDALRILAALRAEIER